MVSGESISGQPIDQFKIFVLSYAPVEGFNESICNLDLQFSRLRIFDHFQHAAGQIIVIATINTPLYGMKVGLAVWLGFVTTVQLTAKLFGNQPTRLYLINTGYQLVCYLMMGAILAAWPG